MYIIVADHALALLLHPEASLIAVVHNVGLKSVSCEPATGAVGSSVNAVAWCAWEDRRGNKSCQQFAAHESGSSTFMTLLPRDTKSRVIDGLMRAACTRKAHNLVVDLPPATTAAWLK